MKSLKHLAEPAYAALRAVSGLLFAFHGAQKILGVYAPPQMPPMTFGSQMWLGGMIELIGGLMILVGWQTRWAAFISSGTMAVAYAKFHWKFQFNSNFWPANNQGELAAIYSFVFLYIACRGNGILAVGKKD
jgi:putative oxidoreductase